MIDSIISPKSPRSLENNGWARATWWRCPPHLAALDFPVVAWQHRNGVFVLSAVEVANEPGQVALGPEYHLSISIAGVRASSEVVRWVLAEFGLSDATEDNHVPGGKVRNFWRPVADKLSGYECPCVDEETAIKEDKGEFVWRAP